MSQPQLTNQTLARINQEIYKQMHDFEIARKKAIQGFEIDGEEFKIKSLRGSESKKIRDGLINDDIVYGIDEKGAQTRKFGPKGSRWKQLADIRRDAIARDTSYFFNPNETMVLQRTMQPVLRWGEPEPQVPDYFHDEDIGRGMLTYTYPTLNNIPAPDESLSFEQRKGTKVTSSMTEVDLLGFFYDYHLSMVQKDASMSNNPIYNLEPRKQQAIIQELTKSLSLFLIAYKYRGTSVSGLNDIGFTGICNDSGVTAQTTIGNSGSLIAYGNITKAAGQLANTLMGKKIPPPYVLDLSPGVLMQANVNQDAANGVVVNELESLFRMTDIKKGMMFSTIRMNPHMISGSAETNTTASMMVTKPSGVEMPYFKYVYSYPLNYYPMPTITLGVDGKILCMGRTIVEQASAIAYGNTLTVNVF